MPTDGAKTFMIEDARIIFRNFAGQEGPYNRAGDRNFAVLLDPATAGQMARDGWNVKTLAAREEGDEDTPYISVSVRFDVRPPRVFILTEGDKPGEFNHTALTEQTVGVLDWADIKNVDLIARGYEWAVGEKTGIKAYVQSLFVTIEQDALERKYKINEATEQPKD